MWPWHRSRGKRDKEDAQAIKDQAVQQRRDVNAQSRRVDEVAEGTRSFVQQVDHLARDVERAFWPRGQ